MVTVTGPAKMIYLAGIGSEDENDGSVRHKDDFLAQCRAAGLSVTHQRLAIFEAVMANCSRHPSAEIVCC